MCSIYIIILRFFHQKIKYLLRWELFLFYLSWLILKSTKTLILSIFILLFAIEDVNKKAATVFLILQLIILMKSINT